ncbi:YitT family protein [Maribacter sp. 2-571]|uniref:YitT family protein n=1 Tax=Maribacter sp. 2-571 TaxID=3417569 RepID=UPI003D33EE59
MASEKQDNAQFNLRQMSKDVFFILTGVLSAAFGLESFLFPNRFIDGGATGISLLVAEVSDLSLSLLIVLVNIPFMFLGWRVIGKMFALKTTVAILLLALTLATVSFPEVTQDKLLVAVFGGFFLGAGIGLSIRGGSVLDGTEVLAIYLSRKLSTTIGDIIILVNILVFMAAAYLLSIETALYSMLTYLAASKTLDFVVEGIEEYTGVTIISKYSEEIRLMLIEVMGRGVTMYDGKGGYGKEGIHNDYDVLFTVITRLEIRRLNIEITKIDPKAFVVMTKINDTRGGMIKKRVL